MRESSMSKEKQIAKEFYDTFGWYRNKYGVYKDTAAFVDMRSVLDSYRHKTHIRVKNFLRSRGEHFLDAGSGAIPHPEYLEYSSDYKWRVCVDLSQRALIEARSKLKEKGFLVLADVTKLPFRDEVFDASILAHVLYHIPRDEQKSVVLELYRTLKSGSSCVIIYSWPTCLITKIVEFVFLVVRFFHVRAPKRTNNSLNEENILPPLYFHAHDYRWFQENFPDDWDLDIRCWRLVSTNFTRIFVPNNFLGELLMRVISWFETKIPHGLSRIGQYPMIIIRKKQRVQYA